MGLLREDNIKDDIFPGGSRVLFEVWRRYDFAFVAELTIT